MENEKIRLTVDVSADLYNRIVELEKFVGAESKAQIFREALRLYEYIAHELASGSEFFVREKDFTEKKMIIIGMFS